MAQNELKGIPLAPLTGVLDLRSSPESIPAGGLRMRQNFQTVAQGQLRRGTGWRKLLSSTAYNNEDFHDQLLALSTGVRQPVTLVFEAESGRQVRSLFLATQCNIATLDEYAGNYRVLGSGYGGTPVTDGTARRFYSAQVGDYVVFTNDFDKPMFHVLEQAPDPVTGLLLNTFPDLDLIGLTRAGGCFSWHNCLFFFDVEMDGDRIAYRLLWSDYSKPLSFDPAVVSSITGQKDLFAYERILAGRPGLGNTFLIYTTHGIWEMSVVGGDQSFAFRRVYDSEKYEGVAVLKYPNTLVALSQEHIYLAEDGLYSFNQYSGQPNRVEVLHRSTPAILASIDTGVCEAHVAAFCSNEILISVARVGAPNRLPDITLRIQTNYQVADIVDHGFTAFTAYRSMKVPNVRDFIIENGICTLEQLQAAGYGYTTEGLPSPLPTMEAPFTPTCIYQTASVVVGASEDAGTAKVPVEVSRSSGVATIKVVGHGLSTGDRVRINGISDPSFNNVGTAATVTDVDHFTYASPGPDVSTQSVSIPTVRLVGDPKEATGIVLVDGTVTVTMTAHGFSTGQWIRVRGKFGGNPLLNAPAVQLTKIDNNTFSYPATAAVVASTAFGATNVDNAIPDRAAYSWNADGTPHYTTLTLVNGLTYYYTPGPNEDHLHLTGPNTDLTTAGSFVYDGAGLDLVGDDDADFQLNYNYAVATSTPPAAQCLAFNNADPTIATHMYVRRVDTAGDDQSQKLRSVQVNDTLKITKQSDSTVFVTVKVTATAKHPNYVEYTFTVEAHGGTLADTDPVYLESIPTSQRNRLVTAKIVSGIKLMISTLGPVRTPTTISRSDTDNPTIVTMGLTAHGLMRGNVVAIAGISDTSFNAYEAKVVVITNVDHPTWSLTDANHFTYERPGNEADEKAVSSPTVQKLTETNAVVEDTSIASDANSLCALLGYLNLDDFCRGCSGATLFVAVSAQDWCLKQLGTVFYRERCANPTSVGSFTDNGYQSAVGSYILDGYDSILRPAPIYTTAPGQPDVVLEEVKISYQAAAQEPPSTVGLKVGISGQALDPNITQCGILWYQHSEKPLKCNTGLSEAQHKAQNTQPNPYTHWNILRKGRFLYPELKISGTGGDTTFTSLTADVKIEGQDNV